MGVSSRWSAIGEYGGKEKGSLFLGGREAWERFFTNHHQVVERVFTAVGLSLPTYGSRDSEISI